MADRHARGDYHLDVRRNGRGDLLTIALRTADGRLVHQQQTGLAGDDARTVYESLMTALDIALRHDCAHLSVNFTPAEMLDLVREDPRRDTGLSPVESALRRWTLYQLRSFSSVTFLGTSDLRFGPATVGASARDTRSYGSA